MDTQSITNHVKKSWTDLLLDTSFTPKHKYNINVSQSVPTAHWYWYRGQNYINVGANVTKVLDPLPDTDDIDIIQRIVWHETAHSLYTDASPERVDEMKRLGIQFQMFNLFEDVRIEYMWEQQFDGLTFGWSDFIRLEPDLTNAAEVLLVMSRYVHEDMPTSITEHEHYPRLCEYMAEVRACDDVLPIIVRFIEEFDVDQPQDGEPQDGEPQDGEPQDGEPQDGEPTTSGNESDEDKSLGDLVDSFDMDEYKHREYEETSERVVGEEREEGQSQKQKQKHTSQPLLFDEPIDDDLDYNVIDRCGQLMSDVFKDRTRSIPTMNPSKRFNKRYGSDMMYKRKQEMGHAEPKVITIILDCSGSMHGEHMSNARNMCMVFNRLAEIKGNFDIQVIPSATNINEHEPVVFPNEDMAKRIGVVLSRAEGIEQTMRCNVDRLRKSHHVYVITDGEIVDEDVNKDLYSRMGIVTYGLYVSEDSDYTYLDRWFDKTVVRKSVLDVFSVVIEHMTLGE